jgi:hypothetical protein
MNREVEIEHRLTKVEEVVALLPDMKKSLDEMNLKFAKYEGKFGTFTLIGTALWVSFVTFKDEIFRWFGKD